MRGIDVAPRRADRPDGEPLVHPAVADERGPRRSSKERRARNWPHTWARRSTTRPVVARGTVATGRPRSRRLSTSARSIWRFRRPGPAVSTRRSSGRARPGTMDSTTGSSPGTRGDWPPGISRRICGNVLSPAQNTGWDDDEAQVHNVTEEASNAPADGGRPRARGRRPWPPRAWQTWSPASCCARHCCVASWACVWSRSTSWAVNPAGTTPSRSPIPVTMALCWSARRSGGQAHNLRTGEAVDMRPKDKRRRADICGGDRW